MLIDRTSIADDLRQSRILWLRNIKRIQIQVRHRLPLEWRESGAREVPVHRFAGTTD